MSESLLPCVEVNPAGTPDAAVIWMHGLGADGHDFESLVPELDLPSDHCIRFVFPHAPVRPVTVNGGMPMRAWYDIYAMDINREVDEDAFEESATQISALIRAEMERGIPSTRIVLAGFSQGGAIAFHAGLAFSEPLAGILALSTYLGIPAQAAEGHASNRAIPIFMAHGTADPVVPLSLAQRGRAALEDNGYAIGWHTYPGMQHALCLEEIEAISEWLQARLSLGV
ncbi:MAG: phospholipase/carboxylesterase [Kiritimatiellia bacterium]|jgi:phospholipase/carboxylesterase